MAVLDSIIVGIREDFAARQVHVSLEDLRKRVRKIPSALSAGDALRGNNKHSLSIIVEVERPSPSKGNLVSIEDPTYLVQVYEERGMVAILVLAEERRFRGSLDGLDAIRARVGTPVLRKDFIVTSYQIQGVRAHGVDTVPLIMVALEQTVLISSVERTHSLGTTVFVETHGREEARRVIDAEARVAGVNVYNLKTFGVDIRVFDQVADILSGGTAKVAEPGVRRPQDVLNYARNGANIVLIGEALVTSGGPRSVIGDMVAVGHHLSLDAGKR